MPATIFYDGHCALCHGLVRFVIAEDAAHRFNFAPLQSHRFARLQGSDELAGLQTVAIETEDGRLLTKSRAILYLLAQLGGLWRVIAWFGRILPAVIADAIYDFIAHTLSDIWQERDAVPDGAGSVAWTHLLRDRVRCWPTRW